MMVSGMTILGFVLVLIGVTSLADDVWVLHHPRRRSRR